MSNGIDTWYDDWELGPGDSLIDIFEGIKESDIFIIIISINSINSKWCKEELDSAFVRKINKNTKLIPIIIDDIEVPTPLNHLKRVKINDINNYDDDFKELIYTIYGISNKPPLGKPPIYTLEYSIEGLEKIDSIIIKTLGDQLDNKGHHRYFSFNELSNLLNEFEFSEELTGDSLEILEDRLFLDCEYAMGSHYPYLIKLSNFGIIKYCENFCSDYEKYFKDVVSSLLNDNFELNTEIYKSTNVPQFIIDSLLELFSTNGFIQIDRFMGGEIYIRRINASGKRKLKAYLN